MSINIGTRKYRNLQEQVAYNTEQIEEILDSYNLYDNVLKLSSLDPLNAEQLAIINKDISFIIYNYEIYYKKSVSGDDIYFAKIVDVTETTVITITTPILAVNYPTGVLTLTNYNSVTLSSVTINSLLSGKADLSGAAFTGAITAPSIIEDMDGYALGPTSDITWTKTYVGACKNGNKLTIVYAGTYTRGADGSTADLNYLTIPSEIGAKLYPFTLGSETRVLAIDEVLFKDTSEGESLKTLGVYWIKSSNTRLFPRLAGLSSLTSAKTYYFRLEATFLLSDSLAS